MVELFVLMVLLPGEPDPSAVWAFPDWRACVEANRVLAESKDEDTLVWCRPAVRIKEEG